MKVQAQRQPSFAAECILHHKTTQQLPSEQCRKAEAATPPQRKPVKLPKTHFSTKLSCRNSNSETPIQITNLVEIASTQAAACVASIPSAGLCSDQETIFL